MPHRTRDRDEFRVTELANEFPLVRESKDKERPSREQISGDKAIYKGGHLSTFTSY